VTLVAVAFGLTASVWSACEQGSTADEPLHLRWSRRLLDMGVTERESIPGFNSKTPVSVINVKVRELAQGLGVKPEGRVSLFCTRLPTIIAFCFLMGTVFLTTRMWIGARASHWATAAAALDPNLIAHSSLATVDLEYALAHILALSAVYHFMGRPGLSRGALLGLAFGLAFCTKFTAFLLLPALALAPLTIKAPPATRPGLGRTLSGLIAGLATGGLLVCAAYRFVRVGAPLSEIHWYSPPMQALERLVPRLSLPLPVDFLTGFDLSLADEQSVRPTSWPVVVLGRMHPNGVWYYFLLLWLMKTPVFLLLFEVWGYARVLRRGLLFSSPLLRFLSANLAVDILYFSLLFRTQIGYRFVLMCIPLGYMIAAAGLESEPTGRRGVFALIVLATVVENTPYLGNHVAFTNAAVRPKERVFHWITDSNVDWGQNRDRLPAYVARAALDPAHVDPVHVLPGRNILRFELASGTLRFHQHQWLRENLEPSGHFRHSYLLFDVTATQFERLLNESRRFAPTPEASEMCAGVKREPALGPDGTLRFRAGTPEEGPFFICIFTPDGADLVLHAQKGSVFIDRVGARREERDVVHQGQMAWYRLEAGQHAFMATLPDRFVGEWTIRRGGASAVECCAAGSSPE